MLPDDSPRLGPFSHGRPNPFVDAILSFVDELKDNEDRKSLFYREVIQVACRVYMADEPMSQSLISATHLSKYITDLETQHRKKSGVRRVFEFAQPLVEGLMQYTSAIDVMIQADPTVSALIYGGAKLVLQLANGYTKYFEQIGQMMADIGVQLQYFHIYTHEFAADKYMNGVLYSSYRDILLFWRDASKILNQRGKRFLAGGLLVPFNESYTKFKTKLDRNAQNVRYMAQALHIKDQGSFNRSQWRQVQDLTTALGRSETSSLPEYPNTETVTKHEEIRRWIAGGRASRIDPQADLDRRLSSRHNGTCQWIFKDPAFTKWESSGESASLWMHAAPGSGKSVLCASVVEKLMKSEKVEQKNVIYFFCRFDEPDKCKAISALRSVALQALKLIKYIPDELYQLYQEECSVEDCFVANMAIAERVVEYLLKRIEYVSVIIDALDECHESALLDSLIYLHDQKSYGITKWFFTSRNDPTISKKFDNMDTEILTVPKKVVQDDIRKYLEDNADLLCKTCNQLDRVTELSQGNFLMMRLTIDPFRNEELTCAEEFEEALKNFQPELGRCWFRSLQRLSQRSEQIQELARLIFTALILAAQPMTFNELLDLLAVKIGEQPLLKRRRTKSVVLSACSPFVEVDYDNDFTNPVLRLVHKTVGDFLTRDPATLEFVTKDCYKFFVAELEGNADLGQRCLTYLSYKRYATFVDLDIEDDTSHGLLKYAAIFWHKHLQRAGKSQFSFEMVADFLKSPNMWTCLRVQSKYAPHMFAKLSYNSKSDGYRMLLPVDAFAQKASGEEFYADALPPWIGEFDSLGDHLVWGYHMFVREWAEVLVGHPNKIQDYFAQVLGTHSFWYTKKCLQKSVRVTTMEGTKNFQNFLEPDTIKQSLRPTWQSQALNEDNLLAGHDKTTMQYIKDMLQENSGEWVFHHYATVDNCDMRATVYRYKLEVDGPTTEDEDDSDHEDDEDGDVPGPSIFHERAIWFLSVLDGQGASHCFHHVTDSGVLQKSAPLFISQSSWLLWPRTELSILALRLDTWESSIINLPQPEKSDLLMISQDYYYSSSTNSLHQASIYGSATNKLTIRHMILQISLPSSSSEPPQITPCPSETQETAWRCSGQTLNIPASFYWYDSTLYAALGSSAVKILRFPLPKSSSSSSACSESQPTSSSSSAIQILTKKLYIPASSYARSLRFLIQPDPSSTSSPPRLRATFLLSAHEKFHLPAVKLDFALDSQEGNQSDNSQEFKEVRNSEEGEDREGGNEVSEDWEEYDPEKLGEGEAMLGLDSHSFLKGQYAAKEQAFSVPIRSGLDWRRSVYVTCW